MKAYRLVALSVPYPGREKELEHWYDQQHIPDCLKLEGFMAAQRFRLDDGPVGNPAVPKWRVMVVYDIESDNIAATMAQIQRVARTAAMPMTDALDMSTALRLLATSASPRYTRTEEQGRSQ
jgi:hypothetical protein